jgi:hypothetical protein
VIDEGIRAELSEYHRALSSNSLNLKHQYRDFFLHGSVRPVVNQAKEHDDKITNAMNITLRQEEIFFHVMKIDAS